MLNLDFPGGSDSKASAYNEGDPVSVPGWGRSPGEGNGNPFQFSYLENSMTAEPGGLHSPWSRKEVDMTEYVCTRAHAHTHTHTHTHTDNASTGFCPVKADNPFNRVSGLILDFPGGSDSKVSAYNTGDRGSVPVLGRSPGEGNSNPLQYSCLENAMDRGAW